LQCIFPECAEYAQSAEDVGCSRAHEIYIMRNKTYQQEV